MATIGAVCWPQVPPERLREIAVAADSAGLDELWLWEDCFWGGAVPACTAVLSWTSRLAVGIGVLPVPLRSVVTAAMDTAMLHRLFPGRVKMGVGHGVQSWMAQAGETAESPVTLLREYLTAMRALLRGETVSTRGRYVQLDKAALEWAPPEPVPVLSAATGPVTMRLTGEAADGAILTTGTSPAELAGAGELIGAGRAGAGRSGGHELIVYLAVDALDEAVVAAGARELAGAGATSVVLTPTQASARHIDPAELARFAAGLAIC